MHVLPFSHKDGVYKHDTDSTGHIEYQMVKKPSPDDVSKSYYAYTIVIEILV